MYRSSRERGFALVITLVMLLVLIAMGVGLSYVASSQADLVAAVANKPRSIDAGETCFDNVLEWLPTSAGQQWINGSGDPIDLAATGQPLAGKTILVDTVPLGGTGDIRTVTAKLKLGLTSYDSCTVQKLSTTTNLGLGNEIGTSSGYGVSSFVYVIKITGQGNHNVPLTGSVINKSYWQSNSSRATLEAVIQYTPG